jgi:hypothetical protein
MGKLFFCNIGWMNRYEGLEGKPDKIVGGGKYVDENETGGEVCNFLIADNGCVYGHVETGKKDSDRRIHLESFGGEGDRVSGIDVVWTASDPDNGGRRVVGWYRDATVFRERQNFPRPPSKQHKKDHLETYRICAKDFRRLDLDQRHLTMGRGPGWMGHTPWWTPTRESSEEIRKFLGQVRKLINGEPIVNGEQIKKEQGGSKSPSAPADPYVRYVQAYEIEVVPRHRELQERFERYLQTCGDDELKPNVARVDLRFRNQERGLVLAEIKPCDLGDARYAIRMAIGQLLDYRQKTPEEACMLIVLEVEPNSMDRELAISNGFGIAYPSKKEFQIIWP